MKPLFILDLDRTLLDVDKALICLKRALKASGNSSLAAIDLRQQVDNAEGSFDTMAYLETQATTDEMKKIEALFLVEAAKTDLLYEDSQAFIDQLISNNYPFMIMTYGGSKWQSIKLKATGLNIFDYLITDAEQKGLWIASLKGLNGYTIPGSNKPNLGSFHKIILVDDKLSNLINLPLDAKGYWLQRQAIHERTIQLPPNVQTISTLEDINI